MDSLFSLASTLVLPFWLAMIVAPTWRWTERIMRSLWPVAIVAAIYAALVLPRLEVILPLVSRPSLQPLAALLGTPDGATIAWLHFLAFDLFVGRWVYLDSRARHINPWLMAPILLIALLVGPLGLLSYLGLRGLDAQPLAAPRTWRPILGTLLRTNRALTAVGLLMLLTLLGTLVGLFVDPRVITGAPAWLKPAKFAISTSIYCFTFVWLLGFIWGHSRLVAFTANTVAVGLTIEVAIIILQVVRGTTSHFNVGTPLDALLFEIMGGFIVLVWLMGLIVAGLLIAQRLPDAAFAWSLRLGLVIALIGMSVAFFMVLPTPDQLAAASNGGRATLAGAHTVGLADGGPGLPIVGWSTVGGDFRVAHFVGIHALQVLPFLGWLLTSGWLLTRLPGLRARHRLLLVWTAGLGYLGLVALLTWQAWRGQSVIAPDVATLAAAAALVGLVLLAALSIVLHASVERSRSMIGANASSSRTL